MPSKLKKWLRSLFSLAFFMIVSILFSGCMDEEVVYVPGTYVNEAEGYYSTLKVSVTVDAYKITEIEILSHEEPQILADIVFDTLPNEIIKKNSIEVDIVAGATYTSNALLNAVDIALDQAKVAIDE